MRILDRYILKSVLTIFFGCLAAFFFLYIIIDLFSRLDVILQQKISLFFLQQYYTAFIPLIFSQVTPIAMLLATLYTFANLNKENEIIAMRSSGLNIFQISRTVIILGVILSMAIFWINDRFVPSSIMATEQMQAQMEDEKNKNGGKPKTEEQEILTNLTIYGHKNRLFFINKFYVGKDVMEGIVILEHNAKQEITKKIVAGKGYYKDGLWRFLQSITYYFDESGQIEDTSIQDEEVMTFTETPKDFLTQRQHPMYMSIGQLQNYIGRLSRSGASGVIRTLTIELYQRFTTPLTTLLIVMVGIPFALKLRKRATGLSSFGVALVVGFLYYVLNAVSIALGNAGLLLPIISVSLSHLMVLALSVYLIKNLP
jgi:lipopolysaccharide export system permease protein